MDRLFFTGLLLGLGALFGTQWLEGGQLSALLQGPAALIVFLGTLGATLLSVPADGLPALADEWRTWRWQPRETSSPLSGRFHDLAILARKHGLVGLDPHLDALEDPFLARALRHVIDGCDEHQLRLVLEADLEGRARRRLAAASILEAAGGYAPTMGILGAVLGLVRAMESLEDPEALGAGIAIAFIATIYGVGLANLVLLPIAARIRRQVELDGWRESQVIEGALALQAGLSPRMIERLLRGHAAEPDDLA